MLVRQLETTAGSVDEWLASRARNGGPTITTSNYQHLKFPSSEAPLAVCVFKVSPRPIPMPEDVDTVANGVRVLIQAPDAYDVDAIGDVDRLAQQLDDLAPSSK